jgi:hypothetical protein
MLTVFQDWTRGGAHIILSTPHGFYFLSVVFSPGRAKKQPTKEMKYHAAVHPEPVEGQAIKDC